MAVAGPGTPSNVAAARAAKPLGPGCPLVAATGHRLGRVDPRRGMQDYVREQLAPVDISLWWNSSSTFRRSVPSLGFSTADMMPLRNQAIASG